MGTGVCRASSLMSAPATKAFSPDPVRITTRTSASFLAWSKAAPSSRTVCELSAFRTAGRTFRPGHASGLPLVVTAGYAGSIVGPLLVGFIADLASLRIAFLVPVVACAVSALAAGATRVR